MEMEHAFREQLMGIGIRPKKNVDLLYTFAKKLRNPYHPYQNEYSTFVQITKEAHDAVMQRNDSLPTTYVNHVIHVMNQMTGVFVAKLRAILKDPMFTNKKSYETALTEWEYRCRIILQDYKQILDGFNMLRTRNQRETNAVRDSDIINHTGVRSRWMEVRQNPVSYSPSDEEIQYSSSAESYDSRGLGRGKKATTRKRNFPCKRKATRRRRYV